MKKLVSVIVPIYNVESYLRECVESIRRQTYHNLEIILINDGSTDSSLDICMEYKRKDNRIQVINKVNGGLSSARNKGIECAKGDYYLFVDSDDFISDKMVEVMIHKAQENNADIVCCNYDFYDDYSNFIKEHPININSDEIYSSKQAQDRLLYNGFFRCYAWNKLYKAQLFKKIRYPIGKLYEDIYTTYSLFEVSDRIVFITDSLYHYRFRTGSITRNTFDERLYQILEPIRKIESETTSDYVFIGCLIYYIFFFNDMIRNKKWDKKVYDEFKELVTYEKRKIKKNDYLSQIDKWKIFVCYRLKNIYKIIFLLYLRMRRLKKRRIK